MKIISTIPGNDFGSFSVDMVKDEYGDYYLSTQAATTMADWQDYIDFNVLPPARLACMSQYKKTVLQSKQED